MTNVRDNDTEFANAARDMWHVAFEAKKAAREVYLKIDSSEADKEAFTIAVAREQAMYEMTQLISSIVIARCDRVLAELGVES
jgi:hypothetical protein